MKSKGYEKIGLLRFAIYCLGLMFIACNISLIKISFSAAQTNNEPDPAKIIALFQQSISRVMDYQCILEEYAVSEEREEKRVYRYYFKRPDWVRMKILQGRMQGSVAVLRAGETRGHRGGLLSLFVVSIDPDDPKVTNIRGERMDESSWLYLLEMLLAYQNNGEVKLLREHQADKAKAETYVLELSSKGVAVLHDELIVREKLWIDAQKIIPLHIERFDAGGRLLQALTYSNVVLNSGLSDKLFKL